MAAVVPVDEKRVDLDDVLDKFSIYKSYHLKIAALIFLGFATNTMYCSNFIFVAEETGYTCVINSTVNNTTDCVEWLYDNPNSFVAEFQLANQEWKRTLVGTVHSFGYMVGLLIVGPLSDRFGRKNAFIMTGVLGGVFGVARSFSHSYWLYIALEFLEAFIGDCCSPAYILITEVVSTKQRLKFILMCTIGYTFGGFATSLAAWLVPYWRNLLQVLYTPALLFFFYKYLLDESPRWLLIKGHKEKAIEVLEKAAKKNNQKLDKHFLDKLSCESNENSNFLKIVKSTFQSKVLCGRFFVCLVWWTTSTFVNYGLTINSVSLQGNKYINFALLSVVDLPGLFIITYILTYCKRKLPLMCCFFAAAVLCVSQPFVPLDLPWLSIVFFMAGKLMSSFYFNITYLYTSELFPTYTRNSMHALCSSLGRIGSIISPQTPLLIQYWFGLPSLIFGLASLFGGFVTFFVPDIADDSLPDTISQAEELGKPKPKKSLSINCANPDVTK
ncbi:solute carrier family 22 member 1 [Papilio machaon]|uniref:solute carrier family 22 member 1 n=1 Tax=Papilio machaon TaxID=76193 RepID=UPI001E665E35|nr:solute carrier family 22 member 1 [Papilio machaon]